MKKNNMKIIMILAVLFMIAFIGSVIWIDRTDPCRLPSDFLSATELRGCLLE